MFSPFRCFAARTLLLLPLVGGPALGAETTLVTETSLRPAPGAEGITAFVTAGTPVELLERREGWVRVRLEGWLRADMVSGPSERRPPDVDVLIPLPEPATPPPAEPRPPDVDILIGVPEPATLPPAVTPGTAVEGLLKVRLSRKKTIVAAGNMVMLVPASVDLGAAAVSAEPGESEARVAELEAQAARLRSEAEDAMHGPSLYESTRRRDQLMEQREELLSERGEIFSAWHGRRESTARRSAVATTITDGKGWFTVPSAPPGTYQVYVRLTRDDLDLEWIETVKVGPDPVRIDLDENNAHGMPLTSK